MKFDKVIEFAKKTWVFWVAAGVITLSTTLVGVSISTMATDEVYRVEEEAATPLPVIPTDAPAGDESGVTPPASDTASVYYVLDTAYETPTAQDISMEDGAQMAMRVLRQLFDADLEGCICHAIFTGGLELSPVNTGRWEFQFKRLMLESRVYTVLLDSVSGEVVLASWYSTVDSYVKEAVLPGQYGDFLSVSLQDAYAVVEEHFLGGGSVTAVEYEESASYAKEVAPYATWEETPMGGPMEAVFNFLLDNGNTVSLIYSTSYGELLEVSVSNYQEYEEPTPEPTPEPVEEPAAEAAEENVQSEMDE